MFNFPTPRTAQSPSRGGERAIARVYVFSFPTKDGRGSAQRRNPLPANGGRVRARDEKKGASADAPSVFAGKSASEPAAAQLAARDGEPG